MELSCRIRLHGSRGIFRFQKMVKETCPYFGMCGGCTSQDTSYQDQLRYKQTYIQNLCRQFDPAEVSPILGSPELWFYRNKMEFVVGGACGGPLVGLRQKQKFDRIVDLKECRIFYQQAGSLLDCFRQWISRRGITPYDARRRSGLLRYFSVRHAKFTGQMLLTVAGAWDGRYCEDNRDAFFDLYDSCCKEHPVKSFYVCSNTGVSDTALTEKLVCMAGQESVTERINGISYTAGPRTFMQTNPYCCQLLYNAIAQEIASAGSRRVLDLFCGCGGITLQAARSAQKVTGIDIVPENIDHARDNVQLNGISNADFVCSDSLAFLTAESVTSGLDKYDAVVVDPPRAGLGKKARTVLLSSGIPTVVYVSCNPLLLAEDLAQLTPAYKLSRLIPVDMFPHTPHMECVAVLKAS